MTQLTLNIENKEMLGVLKKLINNLNGVSIAPSAKKTPSKQLTEALNDAKKGNVSGPFNSMEEVMLHLDQ